MYKYDNIICFTLVLRPIQELDTEKCNLDEDKVNNNKFYLDKDKDKPIFIQIVIYR